MVSAEVAHASFYAPWVVVTYLAGIRLCGYAGIRKEREMTAVQCRQWVKELSLGKGFLVAVF